MSEACTGVTWVALLKLFFFWVESDIIETGMGKKRDEGGRCGAVCPELRLAHVGSAGKGKEYTDRKGGVREMAVFIECCQEGQAGRGR